MKIEIRVDQQRLGDLVTVDQYIAMIEGDPRTIRDILGQFVVNGDGGYLEADEGRKIIGKLTLNQLNQYAGEFRSKAEQSAAPKASEAD